MGPGCQSSLAHSLALWEPGKRQKLGSGWRDLKEAVNKSIEFRLNKGFEFYLNKGIEVFLDKGIEFCF